MANLAIVIPYYKKDFFESALLSLTKQSCKDFVVYVGDDCSPNNPEAIIGKYKNSIPIIYHRFDYNLGRNDLVKHWERCISLTEDEHWIWLFSDDDILDPGCVHDFYASLDDELPTDIYHFNTRVINTSGEIIQENTPYPSEINCCQLFKSVRTGRLQSYVVEYVFSRAIYQKKNGFESFPLAWGSDLATWCKFSECSPIRTINGSKVNWRKSEVNITPNSSLAYEKCIADISCLSWYMTYFLNLGIRRFVPVAFIFHLFHYTNALNNTQITSLIGKATDAKIIPPALGILKIFPGFLRFLRKLKPQSDY